MSSPPGGSRNAEVEQITDIDDDLLHQTVTFKPAKDDEGLTKLCKSCESLVHSTPDVISAKVLATFPALISNAVKAGPRSESLTESLSPQASLHCFVRKIKVGRSSKKVVFHLHLDATSPLSVTFRCVSRGEAALLGASPEHLAAIERARADAAPASEAFGVFGSVELEPRPFECTQATLYANVTVDAREDNGQVPTLAQTSTDTPGFETHRG